MDRPARRLLRSPGFSSLAIGILALGLGAALAVFEVADAVLLRPLPFARPESLVQASQVNGGTPITLDGADFLSDRDPSLVPRDPFSGPRSRNLPPT